MEFDKEDEILRAFIALGLSGIEQYCGVPQRETTPETESKKELMPNIIDVQYEVKEIK